MAALQRAMAQDDGKRLRDAAEKLLDKAAVGEPWALGMLADRLDGKVAQAVELSGSIGVKKAADLTDNELAEIANGSGSAKT